MVLWPVLYLAFLISSLGVNTASIIKLLEARYRAASTLQATFLERYTENGHVVRIESGIAYFRRPGKMRWEYEAPEKNLFLVDGKSAWFYVAADRTVTKMPAKQSSDWRTPLALLAGEMKISRVCSQVTFAPAGQAAQTPSGVVLSCQLKDARQSQDGDSAHTSGGPLVTDAVFFEVAPENGDLRRILIKQSGGVQVEFQFTGWLFNPLISQSMFHFVPPSGVTIVTGELPSSEPAPR
ncbi:MAG: hypothetical protein NVS9B4_23100 [Candidatus Acidiferrum sp.]